MSFHLYQKGGAKVHLVHHMMNPAPALLQRAKEKYGYAANLDEILYLPNLEADSVLLVGLGDLETLRDDDLRKVAFHLAKTLQTHREFEVEIDAAVLQDRCHRRTLLAFAEGFRQAMYAFNKASDFKKPSDITVHYTPAPGAEGKEDKLLSGLTHLDSVMDGVFLARDLVNETANVMDPETLAARVEEAFQDLPVEVNISGPGVIEKLNMQAYLAVAQGSDKEPRLIVLHYTGDPSTDERTALVGKGITYDSGGYCIKSPAGMLTMHADMGGAGTVIGTLYALAKNRAKVNVVGVIAACENLISGHAFKTGDIIGSMSGKTIEVVNTDAEGRLTLADAVYYASSELQAHRLIDLATLTGACVVALGEDFTGALTNNDEFYAAFRQAAEDVGEKVWELPHDDCLAVCNKSKVADLTNSGGREGGASIAGLFVREFLAKDIPWIHLDIAGSAYASKAKGYLPERATGIHVKALCQLLDPVNC